MSDTIGDILNTLRGKTATIMASADSDFEYDPNRSSEWSSTPPTHQQTQDELTHTFLTPKPELSRGWLKYINEDFHVDKLVEFAPALYGLPEATVRTDVQFDRLGIDGHITGYKECTVSGGDLNNKNSMSVNRAAGSKLDFVRGRSGFMPFAPGGVDLAEKQEQGQLLHRDSHGLFDVAPGFERGLDIVGSVAEADSELGALAKDERDEESTTGAQGADSGLVGELSEQVSNLDLAGDGDKHSIDDLLPNDITFGRAQTSFNTTQKTKDWAHVVNVNKEITNFHELVPQMAREFPFELDTFQKEAVYHLEQGDSVFVAAHTSAGKTVIAEYAIAMAQRNMTKAIYTSPIKALSNQKFRDFKHTFDDVGILTGDVQINPEASSLIMTTEILRSMLYRGADLIRDVEFVIFDEVHYVNDADRGVVWEEVIIMLPEHVKFILLSATVPNTFEFANWVGRTKQKDIYVISTPKRPVPLVNYLWCKNQMIEVVDEKKQFLIGGYNKAKEIMSGNSNTAAAGRGGAAGGAGRGGAASRGGAAGRGGNNVRGGRGGRGGARGGSSQITPKQQKSATMPSKSDFVQMVNKLHTLNLHPMCVFVFSRKMCEQFAGYLQGLDFCNQKEKSEIHMFFDKAVTRLSQDDRNLPQILQMREYLSRGIAVHHAGLLPIVKEVVEILFARSLVRVLFATETFAMGLNLPTRTVVFAGTRKHDGTTFRTLLPGEYTQMAGRAGRRGLDKTGTVIIMVPGEVAPLDQLKEMMLGQPTRLKSQFRLTYNMILNLLRIEALKVEEMIKRSFSENANQLLLPEHEASVKSNETLLSKLEKVPYPDCDPYMADVLRIGLAARECQKYIMTQGPKIANMRDIFKVGRVVIFDLADGSSRRIGFISRPVIGESASILAFPCAGSSTTLPLFPQQPGYCRLILQPLIPSSGKLEMYAVKIPDLVFITKYIINNVRDVARYDKQAVDDAFQNINKICRRSGGVAECSWDRLKELELQQKCQEKIHLEIEFSQIPCVKNLPANFLKSFKQEYEEYEIRKKISDLRQTLSDQNLELLPDYEQRVQVLKDLNYVDDKNIVLLKGRVACEINSGFELFISELVLDNFLGDYEPEEIVALLSAFVYEGSKDVEEPITVTPRLDKGRERIKQLVGHVTDVLEHRQVIMTSDEQQFLERGRFGLIEVVYEWARGMTFEAISELTSVQEGIIVRVISRLDEVCREVRNAARIIGDATLQDKMETAQERIKRDIIFCASLYL
ncbi:YALIA101S15e02036g1_1 [Yarrowia lipolytica]|nr:Antiviral helicase SKI2 [Yarrowia lipolytica]SEI36945.1 YALIA101S15e02036g1_1 [Yarrowia lipolytica]